MNDQDLSRFEDNTFDFAYATEATVYAPSLSHVYTEIARVLKPGGVFGVYEWVMKPPPYGNFSPTNPWHLDIRQRLERGDGITNIVTIPEALDAMAEAGLELQCHGDRGDVSVPGEKTWWNHIDGQVGKATTWTDWWTVVRLTRGFWKWSCGLLWVLEVVVWACVGVGRGGTVE